MSGQRDRHSGKGPQESHTPSSTSYRSQHQGQQHSQQQQYLRPEDVYRMEREGSYFTSASQSYTQSRQGSATGSPHHLEIPPHQRLPSQPYSPATYDPYASYQYAVPDPFLSPSSRDSPPEDMRGGESRHGSSHPGSRRVSPKDSPPDRASHGSKSGSPKGKGKERERESEGGDEQRNRRRSSGNDRHEPGGNNRGGKKTSGPGNKLVSGVFIRY